MDYFTHEPSYYTTVRNLDVIGHWKEQTAYYLSKKKGKPRELMKEWIDWALANDYLPMDDPLLKIFRKDEQRDRYVDYTRLSEFLKEVNSRKLLLAATLTSYLPANVRPSLLSKCTRVQFYDRKRVKKEGQIAKSKGDLQTAILKNNAQNKKKENINSISGLLTIESTPLANRSGHSTLTSTCRTATAFANANTERFLSGRRHLYSGAIVLENITGILAYVDLDYYKGIIDKYNLHYVTHDELFDSLKYSFQDYWKSEKWEKRIRDFIETLTPLECTVYLYMGDFYHVRKYNEEWTREMMNTLLNYESVPPLGIEDNQKEMGKIDEFYTSFVAMMVSMFTGKLSIFDDEHKDKNYYGYIGARAKYFEEKLGAYRDFAHAFWRTKFIPAETAMFPHCIRHSVLGGDTDSVLFTVWQWVDWYHGTIEVNKETRKISNLMIYFICMIVKHTLAMVSGQMGIAEEYIHNMKMKNEYYFDTFSPSNRTKHYIATTSMQEGININTEMEVKGVALKNSKAKPELINAFAKMSEEIIETIARGEKVDDKDIMLRIAQMEADIFNGIMHGDVDFLTSRMIKVKEAYNIPMSSDYANYELWQDVFADKYGEAPELPYEGVRISMNIPNKTAMNIWLDNLADQDIAARFRGFMEKHDRKGIASIILPYDVVVSTGIPDELKPSLDTRKIIFANMEQFYILLEMLGIYRINKWHTKLVLDDFIELIPENLREHFVKSRDDSEDEAFQKALRMGEDYDDWDNPNAVSEDDEDEELEDDE